MTRPLAIDLFCGLFGWAEGLVAEGFDVVGFDIEDMCGRLGLARPPHTQLVVQDVLSLDGAQLRDADLIVASPPCTEYSWMAMPWSRAKQAARALRGEDEFSEGLFRIAHGRGFEPAVRGVLADNRVSWLTSARLVDGARSTPSATTRSETSRPWPRPDRPCARCRSGPGCNLPRSP